MTKPTTMSALALMLLSSVALVGSPTFAAEPDVDSAFGPELPAPRIEQPENEGADPNIATDVVILDPAAPIN